MLCGSDSARSVSVTVERFGLGREPPRFRRVANVMHVNARIHSLLELPLLALCLSSLSAVDSLPGVLGKLF